MKTKIFYGNQFVEKFNCDGKPMTIKQIIVRTTKRTFSVLALMFLAMWLTVGGYLYAQKNVKPVTLWAKETIEVPVEIISPVLERIAKCESGNTHYKNGQVIFNANTNGTVDIGKYQINTVWAKKATELGLDITKEKDNEVMALWIYKNRGTEDWYSSKNCWQK